MEDEHGGERTSGAGDRYVSALNRLLVTDPADPGCGHALAALERYAELVHAGSDPHERFRQLAVHFRSCRACRADLDGLLEALDLAMPA
jgi:hypothetical protein